MEVRQSSWLSRIASQGDCCAMLAMTVAPFWKAKHKQEGTMDSRLRGNNNSHRESQLRRQGKETLFKQYLKSNGP
jgi:hypothetical protein